MDRLKQDGQAMAEYTLTTCLVVVASMAVWFTPTSPLIYIQKILRSVLANVVLPMP